MNVDANKLLEEELLKATQERDSFALEIDQKNYSLLETINPAKIRIDYLKDRIEKWNVEKEEIYQNIINRRNFTFEEFKKLIIREVRNFDNIEYTISNGDNSKYISIIIPRIITNKQEIVEYIKNTIYSEQSN